MTSNQKDWIQYSTAIALVISSIVLAFINFFFSHLIHSSVLMYIAQCLAYAAAVFGVSLYFHGKLNDFKSEANEQILNVVKKVDEVISKDAALPTASAKKTSRKKATKKEGAGNEAD